MRADGDSGFVEKSASTKEKIFGLGPSIVYVVTSMRKVRGYTFHSEVRRITLRLVMHVDVPVIGSWM